MRNAHSKRRSLYRTATAIAKQYDEVQQPLKKRRRKSRWDAKWKCKIDSNFDESEFWLQQLETGHGNDLTKDNILGEHIELPKKINEPIDLFPYQASLFNANSKRIEYIKKHGILNKIFVDFLRIQCTVIHELDIPIDILNLISSMAAAEHYYMNYIVSNYSFLHKLRSYTRDRTFGGCTCTSTSRRTSVCGTTRMRIRDAIKTYPASFHCTVKKHMKNNDNDQIIGSNTLTKCCEFAKFYENVLNECSFTYLRSDEIFVPIIKISKSNFEMINEHEFNTIFEDIIQKCKKYGVLLSKNCDILISLSSMVSPLYPSSTIKDVDTSSKLKGGVELLQRVYLEKVIINMKHCFMGKDNDRSQHKYTSLNQLLLDENESADFLVDIFDLRSIDFD